MTADYRRAWKHHRGDTETYQIFHLDTFSTDCFGKPFPASFKRRGTAALASQDPCFIRHFGTALLNDTKPQVLGGPHCAPEHMDCCWKCNRSTQLAEQQAPRHGENTPTPSTDSICHFSWTSFTLTHLLWTQQQLFPLNKTVPVCHCFVPVEQNSPPIPYKRTKDSHTFCPTEQPVRSWKDTCMSWHTTAIS